MNDLIFSSCMFTYSHVHISYRPSAYLTLPFEKKSIRRRYVRPARDTCELYCVHMKSTYVRTSRQADGNFFWLVLSSKT